MLFGRLTFNDIPYKEPIVCFTFFLLFITFSLVIFYISYKNKWKYIWKNWLTSFDHKKIGIMYILLSILMLIRGFVDALMMRFQQFLSSNKIGSFLSSHHYNQVMTAHGVIMIIFMATPLLIGLMNFIIPLQIGSRDLAFPFLNSLSFWIFVSSFFLVNTSLFVGEFSNTGWSGYPPLSERYYNPGVGVDYWIWSIQLASISTTLSSINFIITILFMRAPFIKIMKMTVFTWTVLCSNILSLISFPILSSSVLLLTLDRYLGTYFFTNNMGGNPMMYINLFWAWGHPEVYILILPAFGIFSEVVSTFCKKQIFGYLSLVLATISITILSFLVWLHHFFTMGASANVNSIFGIMTMIIAIPTGIKIFNWIFTMYKGYITFSNPMLWTIAFIITFSIGGVAGIILSIPSLDYVLHNSLFLVAHFHTVIIGGVVFSCFAGLTYWFPKIFGIILDEFYGKISFSFWVIGFYVSFLPLYILGFMGMTRRLSQNIDYSFHVPLTFSFFGVILIFLGVVFQVIQILVSLKNRNYKNLDINDPWDGRTLEWYTLSPPPSYNFERFSKIKSSIDIFWEVKKNKKNISNNKNLKIKLHNGSCVGFLFSIFLFFLCFSFVWYIWWLSLLSFLFIFSIFVFLLLFYKDKYYYIKFK
ncbi:MAG: cbb3-type cytochrome c oxidase subunit I [Enterobacteriaceae bacterium]